MKTIFTLLVFFLFIASNYANANCSVTIVPSGLISICLGDTAVLTAIPAGGTAPYHYAWSDGSTTQTVVLIPAVTRFYSVTITDSTNCTATDSIPIAVHSHPIFSISPYYVCKGDSIVISSVFGGGDSCHWSPATYLSNPDTCYPYAFPPFTMTYHVTTFWNHCSPIDSPVTVTVYPCLYVSESNQENDFSIYPNPATNLLTITTTSTQPSEIILYDIASRKLMQQKFSGSATLNIENLAKGVYLYEVRDEKGVVKQGKVVKE